MRVVLDAGHGGRDPGAVGRGGLQEKQVNLAVALALEKKLTRRGWTVVLTRASDVTLLLAARVAAVQAARPDLLLSLHVNSSAAEAPAYVSGHVLARGGLEERVAGALVQAVADATGWPNGGVFVNNFYLLRESKVPAVLLETGFISNPAQEKWLAVSANREVLAEAIGRGLAEVYGKETSPFRDTEGHWAEEAIAEAKRLGLLFGYPDGTFRPQEPVTRGELAAVMVRLWHKLEAKGAEEPRGN